VTGENVSDCNMFNSQKHCWNTCNIRIVDKIRRNRAEWC